MHLRRWWVGFKREHSARASTFHSLVSSRWAAVEAPSKGWGWRWTRSSGSQRWRPSQRPESGQRRLSAPRFLSRTPLSNNTAICLRSARTAYVHLHRLRSKNANAIHQFWALMKVQEQRPDLVSKSLLELYLKLSFKQHLSNPSVQKYFILLWELYIFPSSKRYKI